MRGHVHKRGRTWTYVLDSGRDAATGVRHQRTKGGFRTRKAAEDALSIALTAMNDGTYISPDPQTVAEWIDRWLPAMEPKVRASTFRDYKMGLTRVKDRLGKKRLQDLRPLDVEDFYTSLLKTGHRFGGGLSPKSVRNVHIALRRSLADAERYGVVPRNVAALVKPPSVTRPELTTWTADDVRTFLASVTDDRLSALYRCLITTGMRRGEALGLRWSSTDLDARRVLVERSLVVVNDVVGWSAPKTPRSRRAVSLDAETVVAMRAHRKRQLEERVLAGDAWEDEDLVFCDELGGPLHPDRFTRTFQSAARRAGVPRIRLHDLRHTWATLALTAGVHPKVVSERLGHATTAITLDVYSHVQPILDAEAAGTVADLFAG